MNGYRKRLLNVRLRQFARYLTVALLCGPATPQVFGQSADALIDKLVEKGILTVKEANQLREEADKNFTQAYSVKSGMPDWVSALKFSGDVRARYEGFYSDANYAQSSSGFEQDFADRTRFRYRLRFGVTASLFDHFDVGLRLTSSDPANGGSGGDPISGNTTLQDNASKKFVYIDQAFGRWNFARESLQGSLTFGKMENPFVTSDMVFDPDYTPEGAGFQVAHNLSDRQVLRMNLGGFVLDELSKVGRDPYLIGAQGRLDSAWTKKIATSAGLGVYSIQNSDVLLTSAVPNQNAGNTRRADGRLVSEFTPIVADASVTYSFDSFPLYKGAFPVKVGGEYMNNPSAVSGADNDAWNLGVTFGKSGKRGTWDISYTYKWLGADAQWEELVDSDFGAFYSQATTSPGAGASAGYASGTNTKGHIVRLAYSPTDALTLSVKWFATELINPSPNGADSQMNRLQLDAMLKF